MPNASYVPFMRAALVAIGLLLAVELASAAPHAILGERVGKDITQPPTDAYCRANFTYPCYSPQEMRTSYGLNGLIDSGMVGAGETIVIIDSYGSPTIAADLAAFDQGFGIPDPPSFTILAPLGTVPWNSETLSWAGEVTLDVEWAHAMAPGASIVLMTSPVGAA